MKIDYYKIYTRTEYGYEGPKVVKSKEQLIKLLSKKSNYLIIGHNNEFNEDFNITSEECEIEYSDEVENTFEVKTYTFKPKELQKESKAKKKQELYNITKEYIDR